VGNGLAVAALPLKGIDLARMDGLRFWVKTDVPTALSVVISEKRPGSNYSAICWSTGNTWQPVELTPDDFHLNEGPNDPADPDGKLDLDAAQNIGILDINTVFGPKIDPDSPFLVDSHAGKHSFFLDDFEILTGSKNRPRDSAVLDDFNTPQLQWLTRGGAELKPEGGGMRVIYQQREEQGILLIRQLGKVDLRGKEKLAFDVASDQPTELVMGLEMHAPGMPQGPRYNTTVEVAGGGKVNHREVVLSAFGDGEAELPPIKLDQLKSLTIVDITGQTMNVSGKNSLWIGNIRGAGESAGQ